MRRAFCLRYPLLLALLALGQAAFWNATRHQTPDMTIVPTPPGQEALDVLSFGDQEFLFRSMAFLLGNAGDTFGRVTPLYKYDLSKVQRWFTLLDRYNHDSNLLPTLAAYYYSQTQRRQDARHMVMYLKTHAERDIARKWWWLVQASYIAMHRLEDSDLALELALPLATAADVPVGMRQYPAFIHEQRGEFDDALFIMQTIQNTTRNIPEDELRFMRYFVEERLNRLETVAPSEGAPFAPGE